MKSRYLTSLVLGGMLVMALSLAGCNARAPAEHTGASADVAAPALTRGEVIRIVRAEVQRALTLRDWHRYSGYIDEYTGAEADQLFTLTPLDRATATGNTSAKLRIVVYEDYECPFCKAFETTSAPALQNKFHSRALFVYRFFPLSIHGKVAIAEAIAGACVARIAGPAAFWRFTQTVFAKTGTNGKGTSTPTATLAKTAMRGQTNTNVPHSLDKVYDQCTTGKLGASLIAKDSSFKGVTGTPTIFVVNMEQHRAWRLAGALPTWVFETLIGNVLADKAGNSDWAVEQHGTNLPNL